MYDELLSVESVLYIVRFFIVVFQSVLEEWKILRETEVLVADTAHNMQGVFNRLLVPDFPLHFMSGKCICHILQLIIAVGNNDLA